MEVIYSDKRIIVAVKPSGILSTDEPGGMPDLIRAWLGEEKACVRTVHRLDQTVSGIMVFARSAAASKILSQQMREHTFHKEYLAVVHGVPETQHGTMEDLLLRKKEDRMTYVVQETGKDVKRAVLHYEVLAKKQEMSLLRIQLETGRTHQIRVQCASRALPLVGDRKYGVEDGMEPIALWSCSLEFIHPESGEKMHFVKLPPDEGVWANFSPIKIL